MKRPPHGVSTLKAAESLATAERELDKVRSAFELAQEEYETYLRHFEDEFGEEARERYEERYV